MVEFIFTLDYEIYGNGYGTLRNLVLDPTQRLAEIFSEFNAHLVIFAEAVELERIEAAKSDPDSAVVRAQMRSLRAIGHEIALHLHPWWSRGVFDGKRWHLDWEERNISTLPFDRIEEIVSAGIQYLQNALEDPSYSPLAFRSGLWAMQPTVAIASVLTRHGILVDSSVFKGGQISSLGLDYRPALGNGPAWKFRSDINSSDPDGLLLELPIHTEMVPFWKMLGTKRLRLQKKAYNNNYGTPLPRRWEDFIRLRYPRKLDFCRMAFEEMRTAMNRVLEDSRSRPEENQIVVAIGHSKDFVDPQAVRDFLSYLGDNSIPVRTFWQTVSQKFQLL